MRSDETSNAELDLQMSCDVTESNFSSSGEIESSAETPKAVELDSNLNKTRPFFGNALPDATSDTKASMEPSSVKFSISRILGDMSYFCRNSLIASAPQRNYPHCVTKDDPKMVDLFPDDVIKNDDGVSENNDEEDDDDVDEDGSDLEGDPLKGGSGARMKEEVEDTQCARLSWLQCTRYKPPKLPRSAKSKEKSKKRKLGRNPRIPFTQHQVSLLEQKFRATHYLSSVDVAELSTTLNLTENRVKIWFQNRRARERREKDGGCSVTSYRDSSLSGGGCLKQRLPTTSDVIPDNDVTSRHTAFRRTFDLPFPRQRFPHHSDYAESHGLPLRTAPSSTISPSPYIAALRFPSAELGMLNQLAHKDQREWLQLQRFKYLMLLPPLSMPQFEHRSGVAGWPVAVGAEVRGAGAAGPVRVVGGASTSEFFPQMISGATVAGTRRFPPLNCFAKIDARFANVE